MAFSSITVSWQFWNPNRTPAGGYVLFTPTVRLTNELVTVVDSAVKATLDSEGVMTTVVVPNDDPDTLPVLSSYRVEEVVSGAPRSVYWVQVPYTATDGAVGLYELLHHSSAP